MSSSVAIRKLKREYASLKKDPPHEGITVRPLESNFLHAHFLLSGEIFNDTPYEGGVYHGLLKFPKEYPFKPPSIVMRTPSGRFKVNDRICFSMSDFHPESWQPSWTIRTIMNGFVSFMNGNDITTGGIDSPASVRIKFAKDSLNFCADRDELAAQIFGDLLQLIKDEREDCNGAGTRSWPPPRPTKVVTSPPRPKSSTAKDPVPSPASSSKKASKALVEPEPGSGKNAAKNKKKREREKRKKLASTFLADLTEQVPLFVEEICQNLKDRFGMDVSELLADHVCYRTESMEQYTALVGALRSASDTFVLLVESEVGGRPIATFKLSTPIQSAEGAPRHSIDVVEIPSPKVGSPYEAGLEHVEFVIGDGTHTSPANSEAHQSVLKAWIERFPSVTWNTKAMDKACNPDISMKVELAESRHASVKFHLISLENVIKVELEEES